MKQTYMRSVAITVTTLLTSSVAFGGLSRSTDREADQDRSTIEAVCFAETGNLSAVVSSYYGQSYLEVFEGNRLVESAYAERTESYAGNVQITGYRTGPITQGGVSLRIRTYDRGAENFEGFGHLTLKTNRAVNKLVECHSL